MLDLSHSSGLPLWLDAQQETLVLTQPLQELRSEPRPRHLAARVLRDPAAPGPEILYWVFRQVALPTDEGVFQEYGVRHNLLLMPPGRIGAEYVKTRGHIQVCPDGTQCPEVYGVLHGRALFLLQEQADETEQPAGRIRLADARWIEAQPGEKLVVPPGYGVVIANLGDDPLVLSNLVSAQAWPVHLPYEQMQGAGYYVVGRNGEALAEPNHRYAEPLPPVHTDAPLHAPELGVEAQVPLYSAFVHHPERFNWLLEGTPSTAGVC